jgi:D-alanine-D-alanine ligase-like ATP-grasp enzyme
MHRYLRYASSFVTAEYAKYAAYDTCDCGAEEKIQVRKTANLHTGGTITDVTDAIHPSLIEAAEQAATALDIPVTGFDMIVPDLGQPGYVMIEANERPGLANH